MVNKVRRWLFRIFQECFIIFFLITVLFVIGIIIGSVTIKILDANQKIEMILFFNSFFKSINSNSFNHITILKQSLVDNFKTVGLIWILGIVFIGLPLIPIIILFRGFALGFTVGFLVHEYGINGLAFSILGILPQNLFIIPGIISIASIGLTFSINSIKMRRLRIIKNNIFSRIIDYTITFFIFNITILIGSIIEGYVSPIFLKMLTGYLN